MIKNVKNNLPPSSRSFHYFETDVSSKLNRVLDRLEKLKMLESQNQDLLARLEKIERDQEVLSEKVYYYLESLVKNGHKTTHDARMNMFKNLPKAKWSVRLCQLANAKLMFELDKILKKNNLNYWASYGTLVGAVVLNGPMPWDDDMDICMTRDDLEKLITILKDNKDYQVTVVYDWYVKCMQYRFCSRNIKIPSFIDIAVWDYGNERTMEKEMKLREIRKEMMDEFDNTKLDYWTEKRIMPRPGSGFMRQSMDDVKKESWEGYDKKKVSAEGKIIEGIFEKYREKAEKEGLLTTKEKAKSLVYAFDNVLLLKNRRSIYEKDMILPVKKVKYENFEISCPNNSDAYLDTCYNDWPYMIDNDDILARTHFNPELLSDPEVQNAMHEFIGVPRMK